MTDEQELKEWLTKLREHPHPKTSGYHNVCPSCHNRMMPRKHTKWNYYCHGCRTKWLIKEGEEPVLME